MRSGSTCKGGDTVSKRKNGTLRAGARLGLNPYSWGNGRGQAMQARKKARRRQPVRATRKDKSILF